MKKEKLFAIGLALATMLLLAACQESTAQFSEDQLARSVRLVTVGADVAPSSRRFIGRVDALSTVDLAFQVGGRVVDMPVQHGALVPEGSLLAALDATDYQLALRDAQVALDFVKIEYDREKQMLERGAAARAAYDRTRAELATRELAVERARRNVEYTRVEAPFDALISRRLVDPHTQVQAGTVVVRVQDVTELRLHISVPEDLMSMLGGIEQMDAKAELSAFPGQHFQLHYREHSTEPDPLTQTYQISFGLADPDVTAILPGMSATVTVSVQQNIGMQTLEVPISALDATADGSFQVWVYDEESSTVSARAVQAGMLGRSHVAIESGLQAGEQIVAAGSHLLYEGMRVVPFALR